MSFPSEPRNRRDWTTPNRVLICGLTASFDGELICTQSGELMTTGDAMNVLDTSP